MPEYKLIPSTAAPSVHPSTVHPMTPPAASNARLVSGSSWMHDDGNASDAAVWAGPWGASPTINYFKNVGKGLRNRGGMCPGFAFDSQGRAYTASFGFTFAKLLAIDANLNKVAEHDVPKREGVIGKMIAGVFKTGSAKKALKAIFRDTSGGAYFVIDDQDRIVMPTSRQTFWIFERTDTTTLTLTDAFDVFGETKTKGQTGKLPKDEWRKSASRRRQRKRPHRLVGTMPVAGPAGEQRYWYTTNRGLVGVVSRSPKETMSYFDLNSAANVGHGKREQIQNSFAVSAKGAFIVSNYALYRFSFANDTVKLEWREEYCRLDCPTQNDGVCPCGNPAHTMKAGEKWAGKGPKPGQIDVGSGTTPTLVRDQFVAIADGAPRLGLLLFYQDHGGRAGRIEVFGTEDSACENSVIVQSEDNGDGDATDHGDKLFIGNSFGYITPFENPKRRSKGTLGMERVDIVPLVDEHPVTGRLKRKWTSPINVGSAPPKLSTGNGLLYAYSLTRANGFWDWALIAFCAKGKSDTDGMESAVVYKLPLYHDKGRIKAHDNAWATMSMGPNRELYLGMWRGFLHVKD